MQGEAKTPRCTYQKVLASDEAKFVKLKEKQAQKWILKEKTDDDESGSYGESRCQHVAMKNVNLSQKMLFVRK